MIHELENPYKAKKGKEWERVKRGDVSLSFAALTAPGCIRDREERHILTSLSSFHHMSRINL